MAALALAGSLGLGAVAVLGVVAPHQAHASTLRALSLTDSIERADHVFIGVVESQESKRLGENIVTEVRIRSTQDLLGVPAGTVFTVRHLGGAVGEIGQIVYGEARFAVGQEVLLIAEKRGTAFYPVGMAQGALHIGTEPTTGQKRVSVDLSGAELSLAGSPQASPTLAPGTVASQDGRPLDEVLTVLRGLLAQKQRKAGR